MPVDGGVNKKGQKLLATAGSSAIIGVTSPGGPDYRLTEY